MKYRITAWVYRNDEMDNEELPALYTNLEEAQKDAEIYYWSSGRSRYSMTVSDGVEVWKWKPGREWSLQMELA